MRARAVALIFAMSLGLCAGAASAEEKSDEPGAICTDRPLKANAPCTVPAGHFQIETDLVSWSRENSAGVRTDFIQAPNPTLKYGLTDRVDVELNIAPWERLRTRDATTGETSLQSGPGDLELRLKWKLADDPDGLSVALLPFLKLPTAPKGLGNRAVEGGLGAPMTIALDHDFTLTLDPEIDVLANDEGGRPHPAFVNLVGLSRPLSKRLTVGVELWSQLDLDPDQAVAQTSADVGASYLLTQTLQLDAGGNFGLSAETPRVQLYLGVSKRF